MTGGNLIGQRVLRENEAGLSTGPLPCLHSQSLECPPRGHAYIGISVCILLPLTIRWCIPGIPVYSLVCFSPLPLPPSSIPLFLPPFSLVLSSSSFLFLRQGLIQLGLALNLLTLLTPVCHQPVQFYVVLGVWS